MKQAIFSPKLLPNNGGDISPAQRGVGTCRQGSRRNHCWAAVEPIGSQAGALGSSADPSLSRGLESNMGPWDVFEPPYLHATEEVGPRDGIWLGTECLLP